MTPNSQWGVSPRKSIEDECLRKGRGAVVDGCMALIGGRGVDDNLLLALGGPGATKFLDGAQHDDDYWLRVWGARGLLWAWDESATPAVETALADESWRVREMGLKIAARHLLGDLLPEIVPLRDDPVARVRSAAARAITLLTEHGA